MACGNRARLLSGPRHASGLRTGRCAVDDTQIRAALRAPIAASLNFTLMVQLEPGAGVVPQVVADCIKSATFVPVNEMLEIVSGAARLFFPVLVFAALVVPTFWAPYAKLAGVTETGKSPVPVKSQGLRKSGTENRTAQQPTSDQKSFSEYRCQSQPEFLVYRDAPTSSVS